MARRQKLFYLGLFEFAFGSLTMGTILSLLLKSVLKKLTFYVTNETAWNENYVIVYHMDNAGGQPQLNSGTPLLEIMEEANVDDTISVHWIPDEIVFGIIPIKDDAGGVTFIERNLDILYRAGENVNLDIVVDSIHDGAALSAGTTQIVFEMEFEILCN